MKAKRIMNSKNNLKKVEMVKSFIEEDFRQVSDYYNIEAAAEILRYHLSSVKNDDPKAIYLEGDKEVIYFINKKGIIPQYKALPLPDGKFRLYELTLNSFNKMERHMIENNIH